MTEQTKSEAEAARELANWMLERPRDGYGRESDRPSYLANRVRARIQAMTDEIAAEIVAEHPHLAGYLRAEMSRLVSNMLADPRNAELEAAMATAVSKAFRQQIAEREVDDDES